MKAIWNNEVLAESNETVSVEGNHYFPPESVKMDFFSESDKQTVCPWKGTAKYYNITVNGKTNESAAWYYPEPKQKAADIKNYFAFWNGVKVEE